VLTTILGALAIIVATINVVGGFMVTNRMLGMFRKKD
jgi:NAD(P) transhydrogenase subunit alpha